MDVATRTGVFDPYVPRVASEWDFHAPGSLWQSVDGSLVFVDISGFTNLSEKLAQRGRIGAEELTSVLNRVFSNMLTVAYARGGSLLKFGGDALLLLFEGPDHEHEAAGAAVDMRVALRESAKIPTSVGKIPLRMSVGVHTGAVDFFLVGSSHRELIITGPVASTTTEMEGTADAGEIVVSRAMREALPADYTGDAKGEGFLLRKRSIPESEHGPIARYPISDEEMERFVPVGLRDNLRMGIRESEHRIATVGFLKYKGIDALMAAGGPEQVGPALDELICIVQEAADAEGVTFLATDIDADGGKIILVAGVPRSQEDDEGRMLRVARMVLDAQPRLAIRFGINRGHVFSGDVGSEFRSTYTIMGDTVNLAARLMAAADPGCLYASPAVIDRSTTMFRTEALEPFYVKGKERPVQAFELYEETGTRPAEARHELPFMGRDAKLETLLGAVALVEEGFGRSITITGDTGMGKTRLIQELHAQVGDARWFLARGEPHGKDNAYWAFRDPLRQLLGIDRAEHDEMAKDLQRRIADHAPDLVPFVPLIADVAQIQTDDTPETAEIEPRFRPDRTADAMVELFETIFDDVSFLVFDDGHWLDPASTSLIDRLSAVAQDHPWMVLVAARTDDSDFEPIGSELPLEPLEPEDARKIVVVATQSNPLRPTDVDNVVSRAGGNPLFLSEIIRVIRETGQATDLPDSLDSVVSSQIDQLPPLTKQVMRYASVLGRSFRRHVLDELLAPEGLEVDEATRRDLSRYIEDDGEARMRFRHAVVHDISYQGLSYHRRQELHARAGEVIERLAGDDPEGVAEFLATHYSAGGVHDKAWRYAVIAGDRARDRYAMNEAAAQYRMAVEASRRLDEVSDEERARILEALGDVCDTAGRYEEAEKAFQDVREILEDDVDAQGRLMAKLGLIREKRGRLTLALRWFRRGLNLVEDDPGATDSIVDLSLAYGGIRYRQGRFHDTIDWCTDVLARDDLSDEQRAHALYLLVGAYAAVGASEAEETGREAIEIYERIGDLVGLGHVLNNMGINYYYRGDWDQALEMWTRFEEARRRTGDVSGAAAAVNNRAEVYSDQGRYDEAEEMFRRAMYEWNSAGIQAGVGLAHLNLGRVLTRMGQFDEAAEQLDKGIELFEGMGAQSYVVEGRVRRAELLLFSKRHDEACDLASTVLDEIPKDSSTLMQRAALNRILGYCSAADGDLDRVEEDLRASLELATKADAEFEVALTLEALTRILRDHPQADEWNDGQASRLAHLDVIATPVVPIG